MGQTSKQTHEMVLVRQVAVRGFAGKNLLSPKPRRSGLAF